jgi:hypothetical protein
VALFLDCRERRPFNDWIVEAKPDLGVVCNTAKVKMGYLVIES